MSRSRFLLAVAAIFAAMVGGIAWYAGGQKTLGAVMQTEKDWEWLYLAYASDENGEWTYRSAGQIEQQEDIAKIAEILADTEVSFRGFQYYTHKDLDGAVWYEVDNLSSGNWVQIAKNGRVYADFPLHSIYQIEAVYEISDAAWQKCAEGLEEIFCRYETDKLEK